MTRCCKCGVEMEAKLGYCLPCRELLGLPGLPTATIGEIVNDNHRRGAACTAVKHTEPALQPARMRNLFGQNNEHE